MSTASRTGTGAVLPGTTRRAERGYTAIEMAVVTVLMAMATLVVERTISAVSDTERLMRAVRTTSQEGPEACYYLRDEIMRSRKLFGGDTIGTGYLTKLDLTRYPILANSRLPIIDEVNPLGPDAADDPHTGNVLLFMREGDPAPCVADALTKKIRSIDTYRFTCVYLTQSNRKLVQGQPNALDLVVWRSLSYPNYGQVGLISVATERTKVVKDLYQRFGYTLLWDPTAPFASAFYAIDGGGNIAATPTVLAKIPEDAAAGGALFVAGNIGVARTDATSRPRMSVFTADDPAVWKPEGLEAKIVGTSGARKVWIRLTVERQARAGSVPAQQTTVVANTRDL